MWNFITDFADTAVTVPLALATLIFLVVCRQTRIALALAIAFAICAGLIGIAKVLLAGCGDHYAVAGIASPSGHTALGTVVYGSLAILLATRVPVPARGAVFLGALGLVLAVATSRLALHDHDLIEVIVALAVGGAAVAVFVRLARPLPTGLPLGWLALVVLGLVLVFHGTRWPTERAVHGVAWYFHGRLPWCT